MAAECAPDGKALPSPNNVGWEPPMVSTGAGGAEAGGGAGAVSGTGCAEDVACGASVFSASGCDTSGFGTSGFVVSDGGGTATASACCVLGAARTSGAAAFCFWRSAITAGGSRSAVNSRLIRPEDHVNSINKSTNGSVIG